jgi:hypothetical protein
MKDEFVSNFLIEKILVFYTDDKIKFLNNLFKIWRLIRNYNASLLL